jgi:hypothetical protein
LAAAHPVAVKKCDGVCADAFLVAHQLWYRDQVPDALPVAQFPDQVSIDMELPLNVGPDTPFEERFAVRLPCASILPETSKFAKLLSRQVPDIEPVVDT